VFGAFIGTVNVIVPDTAPLFVTPDVCISSITLNRVQIEGCPAADILKVYVPPF
jgi:hypothetical protein